MSHTLHCACHAELEHLRAFVAKLQPSPIQRRCRQCRQRFEIRQFHVPGERQQRNTKVYCSDLCRNTHSNAAAAKRAEERKVSA